MCSCMYISQRMDEFWGKFWTACGLLLCVATCAAYACAQVLGENKGEFLHAFRLTNDQMKKLGAACGTMLVGWLLSLDDADDDFRVAHIVAILSAGYVLRSFWELGSAKREDTVLPVFS